VIQKYWGFKRVFDPNQIIAGARSPRTPTDQLRGHYTL